METAKVIIERVEKRISIQTKYQIKQECCPIHQG